MRRWMQMGWLRGRVALALWAGLLIYGGAAGQLQAEKSESQAAIKVGWIGPITGPLSKWGSYQAALLALEDVNAAGGIRGRKLELIFEDGKGQGKEAASAAQKLINVDQVKYILGGHCTPESLAVAPIAEKAGVIMMAAITSNPYLTTAGDNIFRVTAVSVTGAERLFAYASKERGLKRFAVIYEETDYPRPQAEKFRSLVQQSGGVLVGYQGFPPSESDFRTVLSKIRLEKPDALYLATSSPDFVILLFRQIRELGLKALLLGNENSGIAVNSAGLFKPVFDGVIYAASKHDPKAPKTRTFNERYQLRYGFVPPYGAYTAEGYDTVMLLAEILGTCGDNAATVKKCLYAVRNYEGASGSFSIDLNGDAQREYEVLQVLNGVIGPVR